MVSLVPMTPDLYRPYLAQAIQEYAEDHVRGGRWARGEALEQSRREFESLLPDALATPGHYLCSVVDDQLGIVGVLWYAIRTAADEKSAFIYDIRIDDQFQGRGIGSQALLALEPQAAALGARSIGLHVFGHNEGAYRLYKKLGYAATNIVMSKSLGDKS